MEPTKDELAPRPGTPEHAAWLKKYNKELLRRNPQWGGKLPTQIARPKKPRRR
jgi:hypothetical protein